MAERLDGEGMGGSKPTKRRSQVGKCCPVMELVLSRQRDKDRLGLVQVTTLSFETGRAGETLVIRFNKDRKRSAVHADVCWAPVIVCPFCGTRLSTTS